MSQLQPKELSEEEIPKLSGIHRRLFFKNNPAYKEIEGWVIKSKEEQKITNMKGRFLNTLIVFFTTNIFLIHSFLQDGYSLTWGYSRPYNIDYLEFLPMQIIISSIVAFLNYLRIILIKPKIKTYVCLECDSLFPNRGDSTCSCSGEVVDIRSAKWGKKVIKVLPDQNTETT